MPQQSIVLSSSQVPEHIDRGVLWVREHPVPIYQDHPLYFDQPGAVTVDELVRRGVGPHAPPDVLYEALVNDVRVPPDRVLDLRQPELLVTIYVELHPDALAAMRAHSMGGIIAPPDRHVTINSSTAGANVDLGVLWVHNTPMYFDDPSAVTIDEIVQRSIHTLGPHSPRAEDYVAYINDRPVDPETVLDLRKAGFSIAAVIRRTGGPQN